MFYQYHEKVEAKIIFTLSEPDFILKESIAVRNTLRSHEILEMLNEWCRTAPLFYDVGQIIKLVNNVTVEEGTDLVNNDSLDELKGRLFFECATSLIAHNQWKGVQQILEELQKEADFGVTELNLRIIALNHCIQKENITQATVFLDLLLTSFDIPTLENNYKIHVADIVYEVKKDLLAVKEILKGVAQPEVVSRIGSGGERSFKQFIPRIKYNKLLNLTGQGVSISKAVPDSTTEGDSLTVEFERMLCLIVQLMTEGIQGKTIIGDIVTRCHPIFLFYYQYRHPYDNGWYDLKSYQAKYFTLLLQTMRLQGDDHFNALAKKIISDFDKEAEYWNSNAKREVLMSLFELNYNPEKLIGALKKVELGMLDGKDVTGSVDQCALQVTAWIKAGKKSQAKQWIMESFKQSVGIGYRKDFQLNTWLEWLDKVSELEPEQFEGRITWFLQRLKYLKDTTETSACHEASKKILRISLRRNYDFGEQVLRCLFEQGFISYEDGLRIFIQETLDQPFELELFNILLNLFSQQFLLFSKSGHPELLKTLIRKGIELKKQEFLTKDLPILLHGIITKPLEKLKGEYLNAFAEVLQNNNVEIKHYTPEFFHQNVAVKPDDSESKYGNTLVILPDHIRLSETEVLAKVTEFTDLKNVLSLEDRDNSFFDWSNVIEKIASKVSIQDLKELPRIQIGSRYGTKIWVEFSKLALAKGSPDLAREFATKAINLSSSSGWISHSDGGTRIASFKALSSVSDESTSIAFDTFTSDLMSTEYPSSFLLDLDDILAVITKQVDATRVWAEVEQYLTRLMINSSLVKIDFQQTARTQTNCILDFLIYLASFPITAINVPVKQLISKTIHSVGQDAIEKLKSLGTSEQDTEQMLFTEIVAHSIYQSTVIPVQLHDVIYQLTASTNYFVRSNNSKLLKTISQNLTDKPVPARSLSSLFSLELIEATTPFKKKRPLKASDYVSDTQDPSELIRPYDYILPDALEALTGLRKTNIIYRWAQIMKSIDNPEKLTASFEAAQRSFLHEIELSEYPHTRPRTQIAKRALWQLLTELLDSETLSESFDIDSFLGYDFAIVNLVTEHSRPDFVPRLATSDYLSTPEKWVNAINDAPRLKEGLIQTTDNWYVVAEYSEIKSLDWGMPTETYASRLISSPHNPKHHDSFFTTLQRVHLGQYDALARTDDFNSSIDLKMDMHFDQFDKKSMWLALNPFIAKQLGWVPGKLGSFSWLNSKGEKMAESRYWVQGNTGMQPPIGGNEVGEGWLLVVSSEALDLIRKHVGGLIVSKQIQREYNYQRVLQRQAKHQTKLE